MTKVVFFNDFVKKPDFLQRNLFEWVIHIHFLNMRLTYLIFRDTCCEISHNKLSQNSTHFYNWIMGIVDFKYIVTPVTVALKIALYLMNSCII